MKLRPHHLLCTQGYSGKGYSTEFVTHMNKIVTQLCDIEPAEIEIIFGTDDLCVACPHKAGENLCATQEKVNWFDQKVVEFFNLQERKYIYQDLIKEIDENMTEEMMDIICEKCSWYPISACKRNVCKKVYNE